MTVTAGRSSDDRLVVARSLDRVAGPATMVAAAAAAALLLALHVVRPDLDPSWSVVSQYALGPAGWLMTAVFALLAVSCVMAATTLRHLRSVRGRIGVALLPVAAIGLGMAAVFALGQPLHEVASMVGNLALPLAALLAGTALRRTIASPASRRLLLVLSHLPWVTVIAMTAALFTATPGIGWINRLVVAGYCAWLVAVGALSGRAARAPGVPDPGRS